VSEFAGNYEAFDRERAAAFARQGRAYVGYVAERDRFGALLETRREQARHGVHLGQRETQALKSKVAQAKRRLERLDEVEKPWRPWQLELTLAPSSRSGDVVARLDEAVVERGSFRLGPIDVLVGWGDRVAIVGPNGAGKTTLLRAISGELPLARGTRTVGTGVVFGELDQRRELFAGEAAILQRFGTESGLLTADARTLLAKFGIRGEDALRPAQSLSPGERSRAVLAVLQARGVNCLILDEPTNHLDLEAIEQLEAALADYAGTLLLVTHDRRFLERFAATRTVTL
jgi:ATPase subunit of ABC transporter with duplicated ATPase domains